KPKRLHLVNSHFRVVSKLSRSPSTRLGAILPRYWGSGQAPRHNLPCAMISPTCDRRRRLASPRVDKRGVRGSFLLASPGIFTLVVFFLLPLVFVVVASFMTRGLGGTPTMPLTLDHYERTFGVFAPVVWRTVYFAAVTTFF